MGILHVCPLHSLTFLIPGPLTVRTLRHSRLRSAPAIQLVPAESAQKRRAGRAPILPAQAEELHAAVGQVCVNRLGEDVGR
eukprot:6426400-Alexandrium_andersonii.AAC.1